MFLRTPLSGWQDQNHLKIRNSKKSSRLTCMHQRWSSLWWASSWPQEMNAGCDRNRSTAVLCYGTASLPHLPQTPSISLSNQFPHDHPDCACPSYPSYSRSTFKPFLFFLYTSKPNNKDRWFLQKSRQTASTCMFFYTILYLMPLFCDPTHITSRRYIFCNKEKKERAGWVWLITIHNDVAKDVTYLFTCSTTGKHLMKYVNSSIQI